VKKILIFAANPKDTNKLRIDEEVREIQTALKLSKGHEQFQIISQWAVRPDDVRRALLEHEPQIVHFSGHGTGERGLVLEDETGQAQLVSGRALARLFKLFAGKIQCVLLNACYSEVQADAIAQQIDYVIGMNQAIGDRAAIKFAVGFYDALGYGRSFQEAYEFGLSAIDLQGIPETSTPVFKAKPQSSCFPKEEEIQSAGKRERAQQELLNYVASQVEGRLNYSLHNRVSIFLELEKEEDPSQVNPPWEIYVKIGTKKSSMLSSETKITDIYDRKDIQGRLLILGAPGSGKTTMLLQLAQVLICRSQEDINQPIPVLLDLSSWKDDKQSIKNWILDELTAKRYKPIKIRKDIAEKWLADGTILPFLDGLDELASDRQEACVKLINQFLNSEWGVKPLVVCSRTEEYQLYKTQLELNGSIIIQPLNQRQIQDYVLRTEGEKLWHDMRDDQNMMELAKTPLLLNIIVISYDEISFEQWHNLKTPQKRLSYLFDAYIRRMFSRRYQGKQPIREDSLRWLKWLANQLTEQKQTQFFIENLQPNCLNRKIQKRVYWWVIAPIRGMIGWQIGWLIGWAVVELFFDPYQNLESFTNLYGSSLQIILGLAIAVISSLTSGTIMLIETIKWGLPIIGTAMVLFGWFILALFIGLLLGIFFWIKFGLIDYLIYSLIYSGSLGIISGAIAAVIGAMAGPPIETRDRPNQGMFQSVANTIIISIVSYPICVSIWIALAWIFKWIFHRNIDSNDLQDSLIFGTVGVFSAILLGGCSAIQHLTLRFILWSSGAIPWNYARFLNYATNRLFLQRVGGGYRFIHNLLQIHFTQIQSDTDPDTNDS
jgi:energy-coupling factor transporter ATP-binding protein EcfA2